MADQAPDSSPAVTRHAAWAMAVGGMIGGGIYALVGVAVATAGSLAWLSIVSGAAIALVTVKSYARLTSVRHSDGALATVFERDGKHALAGLVAWWLVLVYVLALAVYTYTAGHYVGRALGLGTIEIALVELVIVAAFVGLNLLAVEHSARVQIIMVWLQLAVLASIAAIGVARAEHTVAPAADISLLDIIEAATLCFVAFEGFEMLAYDLRDVQRPRRMMRATLPLAVIVVAAVYIAVTLAAVALVGATALAAAEDNALAIAGRAAAGSAGFYVVTVAAAAAAVTAINATLFSTARLARTSAQRGLLPRWCGRCNKHDIPVWPTLVIGALAGVIAAVFPLEALAGSASLGFLLLFGLVNLLTWQRAPTRRWLALLGAVAAFAGALLLLIQLARDHIAALAITIALAVIGALLHHVTAHRPEVL